MKDRDYKRLLLFWMQDNAKLIFLTSWLSALRQVKVLRFMTQAGYRRCWYKAGKFMATACRETQKGAAMTYIDIIAGTFELARSRIIPEK